MAEFPHPARLRHHRNKLTRSSSAHVIPTHPNFQLQSPTNRLPSLNSSSSAASELLLTHTPTSLHSLKNRNPNPHPTPRRQSTTSRSAGLPSIIKRTTSSTNHPSPNLPNHRLLMEYLEQKHFQVENTLQRVDSIMQKYHFENHQIDNRIQEEEEDHHDTSRLNLEKRLKSSAKLRQQLVASLEGGGRTPADQLSDLHDTWEALASQTALIDKTLQRFERISRQMEQYEVERRLAEEEKGDDEGDNKYKDSASQTDFQLSPDESFFHLAECINKHNKQPVLIKDAEREFDRRVSRALCEAFKREELAEQARLLMLKRVDEMVSHPIVRVVIGCRDGEFMIREIPTGLIRAEGLGFKTKLAIMEGPMDIINKTIAEIITHNNNNNNNNNDGGFSAAVPPLLLSISFRVIGVETSCIYPKFTSEQHRGVFVDDESRQEKNSSPPLLRGLLKSREIDSLLYPSRIPFNERWIENLWLSWPGSSSLCLVFANSVQSRVMHAIARCPELAETAWMLPHIVSFAICDRVTQLAAEDGVYENSNNWIGVLVNRHKKRILDQETDLVVRHLKMESVLSEARTCGDETRLGREFAALRHPTTTSDDDDDGSSSSFSTFDFLSGACLDNNLRRLVSFTFGSDVAHSKVRIAENLIDFLEEISHWRDLLREIWIHYGLYETRKNKSATSHDAMIEKGGILFTFQSFWKLLNDLDLLLPQQTETAASSSPYYYYRSIDEITAKRLYIQTVHISDCARKRRSKSVSPVIFAAKMDGVIKSSLKHEIINSAGEVPYLNLCDSACDLILSGWDEAHPLSLGEFVSLIGRLCLEVVYPEYLSNGDKFRYFSSEILSLKSRRMVGFQVERLRRRMEIREVINDYMVELENLYCSFFVPAKVKDKGGYRFNVRCFMDFLVNSCKLGDLIEPWIVIELVIAYVSKGNVGNLSDTPYFTALFSSSSVEGGGDSPPDEEDSDNDKRGVGCHHHRRLKFGEPGGNIALKESLRAVGWKSGVRLPGGGAATWYLPSFSLLDFVELTCMIGLVPLCDEVCIKSICKAFRAYLQSYPLGIAKKPHGTTLNLDKVNAKFAERRMKKIKLLASNNSKNQNESETTREDAIIFATRNNHQQDDEDPSSQSEEDTTSADEYDEDMFMADLNHLSGAAPRLDRKMIDFLLTIEPDGKNNELDGSLLVAGQQTDDEATTGRRKRRKNNTRKENILVSSSGEDVNFERLLWLRKFEEHKRLDFLGLMTRRKNKKS